MHTSIQSDTLTQVLQGHALIFYHAPLTRKSRVSDGKRLGFKKGRIEKNATIKIEIPNHKSLFLKMHNYAEEGWQNCCILGLNMKLLRGLLIQFVLRKVHYFFSNLIMKEKKDFLGCRASSM